MTSPDQSKKTRVPSGDALGDFTVDLLFKMSSQIVDPKDVAVLASYRRAIARHMYTDEVRFEQVQIHVREHLLKTVGCQITDVEEILQWNWIARNKCRFRLAGQPLRVLVPSISVR